MNANLKSTPWKRLRMRILLLGATLSIFTTASFASIITNGTFSIAGTIFVTGVGPITTPAGTCLAGIQCFQWQDTANPALTGKVDINASGLPNGDIPLAIAGNDAANMFQLNNPPDIPPSFPAVPLMSFNSIPGLTTVLLVNNVPLGINGTAGCPSPFGSGNVPAAGQTCTIPGSPFNLQNLSTTQSIVTFRMAGFSADGTSTWSGTFTSQFNNIPYQTIIQQLNTNGFVFNSFSAQITLSPVPEPGSLSFLLLGSGMIVSATLLRRMSRR
jgi:hypothetical protein